MLYVMIFHFDHKQYIDGSGSYCLKFKKKIMWRMGVLHHLINYHMEQFLVNIIFVRFFLNPPHITASTLQSQSIQPSIIYFYLLNVIYIMVLYIDKFWVVSLSKCANVQRRTHILWIKFQSQTMHMKNLLLKFSFHYIWMMCCCI